MRSRHNLRCARLLLLNPLVVVNHLQFRSGRAIEEGDDVLVKLQSAGGDHAGNRAFDGGGYRVGLVLAGGGLKTGQVIGTTDELGKKILDTPISIADFHATIYAALGINPAEELYDGVRPVPITDRGKPALACFG